jgi:hypothetical protein
MGDESAARHIGADDGTVSYSGELEHVKNDT